MERRKQMVTLNLKSLVPASTGTGFLIFGSRDLQCHVSLGLYLLVAGSISLAIPILSSIFKALIRRFYMVTDLNQPLVLKAMNLLSNFVITVEIIILLSGAIVILPYLPSWQYQDESETGTYCDLSLMLFSLTFLTGAWLFIFAGGIIFTVIHLSNRNAN